MRQDDGLQMAAHERQRCRTMDEVLRMYGLDRCTLNMWINRFSHILGPRRDEDGTMIFTGEEVKHIGLMVDMVRAGEMRPVMARKYLEKMSCDTIRIYRRTR
jgi:hypothetical protein